MSEARHLAAELRAFVESEQPWFPSLLPALDGVDARTATKVPVRGLNSVWATVNHISFWLDLARRRVIGEPTTDAEARDSGWSIPAAGTGADWERTLAQLAERTAALAAATERLSDADLARPCARGRAPRWQVIHGAIAHTSHHTADVLTARALLRLPRERSRPRTP